MAGKGWRQFTRERLSSGDFQGYAVDQANLVFASANARSAALPSPSEGMVSFLLDGKVWEDFVNGGWRRRRGSYGAGFSGGTYAGTNNYRLAQVTVNPGRPYQVTVRATGLLTVGANGSGTLRLLQGSTVKAQSPISAQAAQRNVGPFVERTFDVPDGSSQTFDANLDVAASSSIVAYTDDSHSYLQANWTAL